MKTCKKCVMTSEYPGIELDTDGICQLCHKPPGSFRSTPSKEIFDGYRNDFEETLQRVKGKYLYDGLLCLSGGKDSAYLAHILQKKYNLRLLAFNVQSGFGSDLAKSNVDQLVDKLNLPLKTFTWPDGFGEMFYRYFFLNPLRQGLTATVCRVCQTLLLSSTVQAAKDEGIPLIFHGYSLLQMTKNWCYEITRDTLVDQYNARTDFWKQTSELEEIRNHFHFPSMNDVDTWPRILMPLHVIDCPTEDEIRIQLNKLNLLPTKKSPTRKTTCILRWLMAYLDTRHFGEPPFRDWISEKIRLGEASRFKYLLESKGFSWLCKHHLYRPFFIQSTLKRLGLTEQEVLKAMQESTIDESIFNDIYKINPSRDILNNLKDK